MAIVKILASLNSNIACDENVTCCGDRYVIVLAQLSRVYHRSTIRVAKNPNPNPISSFQSISINRTSLQKVPRLVLGHIAIILNQFVPKQKVRRIEREIIIQPKIEPFSTLLQRRQIAAR
jgi:hypothetical protein